MAASFAADLETARPRNALPAVPSRLSVLVGIASYGTGQDHFLEQVMAEFRSLDMDCRVVVLSNIDKPIRGAETRVGLPSSDTYSLPFAHRPLFREYANDYDLFIYTEDDTLITPANIRAFLEVQQVLADDEVAGFLRCETKPDGSRVIVSANSHFRWLPNSAFTRGGYRFAQFSNQHSGCFIVTRGQLARAIASGGFTVEPRRDCYGMLETAASDIYTQCGLKRVICLSRMEEFIVPHLANKYFRAMGIPESEFAAQARAVGGLPENGPATSLFDPETRAPDFRWSKMLYGAANADLLGLVPASARRVLSIGATTGNDEAELRRRGMDVSIIPLDAVFGDALQRKGFTVHGGPLKDAMASLAGAEFDVVLAADVLHLLPQPDEWLRDAAKVLSPNGEIVGSVSNTSSWLWPLRDWHRARRRGWIRPSYHGNGAHPMSERRLRALCRSSLLALAEVRECTEQSPKLASLPMKWARRKLAPGLMFRARRTR